MCELIHVIEWEAKKRVVSHAVVSCRVVYVWTDLYLNYKILPHMPIFTFQPNINSNE